MPVPHLREQSPQEKTRYPFGIFSGQCYGSTNWRIREGRSNVRRSCAMQALSRPERAQHLPAEVWRPADGILFSVLSSLVLWSALFTSLYTALD